MANPEWDNYGGRKDFTDLEIASALRDILHAFDMTHQAIGSVLQNTDVVARKNCGSKILQAREAMDRVRELLPEHLLERLGRDV